MIRVMRHIVSAPLFWVGYALLWIAVRIDGNASLEYRKLS